MFTLNNPETDELEINDEWKNKIKECCYQMEMGETGTRHLQGWIELKNPQRMSAMKRLIPRAHWEKRRGTLLQALEYVTKETSRVGDPIYFGSQSTWNDLKEHLTNNQTGRGRRSGSLSETLLEIQDKLRDGSTCENIADEYFDIWVRYYRAFERYQLIKTPVRNHEVTVHVLQGPTGTGKSKWALDTYPNAYWKQRSNWWCGYMGHRTVVIDEFYGWLPFDLLLRLCDRYPMQVETKGGQVQFVADTIIITTNQCPNNWYRTSYFPAFQRRVSFWHILPIWGEHETFTDFAEALPRMSENVLCP